jgi:FkbM family methyltransferase
MKPKFLELKRYIKRTPLIFWILSPLIYLRKLTLCLNDKIFSFIYSSILSPVSRGSLVVPLKEYEGEFEIDVRSHILRTILKEKTYEQDLASIVRQSINPNMDVIDVGANIGLYTILCCKLIAQSQRVLAIEPAPEAIEYLSKNIVNNNCTNVIIYRGMAIERSQSCQLRIIPGMSEYSSASNISHKAVNGIRSTLVTVPGKTIDSLVEEYGLSPGFVKMDIEGGEYLALMGAISTLQKHKPVILLEVSNDLLQAKGYSSKSIEMLLLNNDYQVFSAEDNLRQIKHPLNGEILAIPTYHP